MDDGGLGCIVVHRSQIVKMRCQAQKQLWCGRTEKPYAGSSVCAWPVMLISYLWLFLEFNREKEGTTPPELLMRHLLSLMAETLPIAPKEIQEAVLIISGSSPPYIILTTVSITSGPRKDCAN